MAPTTLPIAGFGCGDSAAGRKGDDPSECLAGVVLVDKGTGHLLVGVRSWDNDPMKYCAIPWPRYPSQLSPGRFFSPSSSLGGDWIKGQVIYRQRSLAGDRSFYDRGTGHGGNPHSEFEGE